MTTKLFGGVLADANVGVTRDSSGNATLETLESALAGATAMTMWAAARAGTLQGLWLYPNGRHSVMYPTITRPVSGETSVTERVLVGRVKVSYFAYLAVPVQTNISSSMSHL